MASTKRGIRIRDLDTVLDVLQANFHIQCSGVDEYNVRLEWLSSSAIGSVRFNKTITFPVEDFRI